MSYIDEVAALEVLTGMSTGDAAELSTNRDVVRFLDAAQASVRACLANMGMEGEAGTKAKAKAEGIVKKIDSLKLGLSAWSDANRSARGAMREAASHAPELEAACAPPLSNSPAAAAMHAAAVTAAQARAWAILDQMNKAVEAAIPPIDRPGTKDPDNVLARRGDRSELSGGSGWDGVGGAGTPSGVSGWALPVASRFEPLNGGGDPGVYVVPGPDGSVVPNPAGLVAGAGLVGAAAVAAAIACGAGSASALPSLGAGALTVAPVGGIYGSNGPVTPAGAGGTTGMVPGMGGGAGSGNERGKKRRGYKVQHIDTGQGPVDPGWGALAGSVDTMPPLPEPEEDWW